MNTKKLIPILFFVLILATNACAVRTEQTRAYNAVITYDDACFKLDWDTNTTADHVSADFNNWRIITTSSDTEFDGLDFNTTGASEYEFCSVSPGDSMTAVIQRYDGNKLGHYLSEGVLGETGGVASDGAGDTNTSINQASVTDAGLFLFFQVIAGIAGMATLIIIISVIVVLLAKLGLAGIIRLKK